MAHKRAFFGSMLAAATLALGLAITPAYAHDELLETDPAANAQLEQAPTEINLTFSGDIMEVDGANQVRVVDGQGNSVVEGAPSVNKTVLTQDLTSSGAADESYTVTWRVVSSDGHPIEGTFSYTVGAGAQAAPAATASSAPAAAEATTTAEPATGLTPTNLFIFVAAGVVVIGAIIVILRKAKK